MAQRTKKMEANLNRFINTDVSDYTAIKRHEFQLYYGVIRKLLNRLHSTMKEVDPYYKKYSSNTSFAGSHFDNLRVTKPDEFDIIFTVNLPLHMYENKQIPALSDINIIPQDAGFVELLMGHRFDSLPDREDWETNSTAYSWRDEDGFLLRSKFKDWFKGVVQKAFNRFETIGTLPAFKIKSRTYIIRRTEAGPSLQLIIEDDANDFKMDVDLVPALKFPETRWPIDADYSSLPFVHKKHDEFWVVVPKPNKNDPDDETTISRTWRIGLQNQERDLMFDLKYLKPTIRLMKKLRDAQGMDKIASYYIKTIFFWEIQNRPESFWNGPLLHLFETMVGIFHDALESGEILYFWNPKLNFIENVNEDILDGYCRKLKKLLEALSSCDTDTVAQCMLTEEEYIDYSRKNKLQD